MTQPSHPTFIQIETTLACNAECPFCSHATLTRRPRRMEDWLWKKIIDETRGLGVTYRPFLINEPLADHRLGEIMRYIRRDDTARIELNSNGELMPASTSSASRSTGSAKRRSRSRAWDSTTR